MSDNSKKINMEDMGKVSGGITQEQAYDIALKHAKVRKDQASLRKSKLDRDDGISKFEIDFTAGTTKYEYDIDPISGRVLGFESESIFDD